MDVNPESRPARRTPLFPRSGGGEWALFGVMAIMSFLACLTLLLALGTTRLASAWAQGLTGQATVQIVDIEGVAMEVQVAAAVEVLKGTPGIGDVRVLSREESEALLRPWLGEADLAVVPVPVLLAVTLDPSTQLDVAGMVERLKVVAPGATFDDHSRWNASLSAASSTVGWAAYGILALIAAAAAAAVVFATRAALQTHRDVVDVLHMTGARAGFIARQVQWRFFRLGGEAALLGLLCAGMFALVMWNVTGVADSLPALTPGWADLLWFLAVPAAAALLAMVTARAAVGRFLSRAP